MGRAKLNMFLNQFGHCKDDCIQALKFKEDDAQAHLILTRSRYFVEKYLDAQKYV